MTSESGSPPAKTAGKDAEKKLPGKGQDVNGALRRAYESAVDETIPQSMLDLLNKLS
ncbi:NepR family anti-sigma factor [Sphingopyxis sp. H050]|jgi:Anti-sigma factor NepR|uniref:NepR family anti-sigma factor n=1 Tax=Sphingopyxis sp. H050 TaxID=1759072 RepID=UPI000B2F8E99|nr:NepR family anti-sigma factor [Sphingopyxis sp. H050]